MTARSWRTADDEYGLVINDGCWDAIEQESSRADGKETGGILIGYYTVDRATAMVTKVLGPPGDSESGPTWFRRGVAGLSTALRRLWQQPCRIYYIGEWHYHPSISVEPSRDDVEQMMRISGASNYQCREPIMLLVGKVMSGDRPVKAFVFPLGQPPLEMRHTGDGEMRRGAR